MKQIKKKIKQLLRENDKIRIEVQKLIKSHEQGKNTNPKGKSL